MQFLLEDKPLGFLANHFMKISPHQDLVSMDQRQHPTTLHSQIT